MNRNHRRFKPARFTSMVLLFSVLFITAADRGQFVLASNARKLPIPGENSGADIEFVSMEILVRFNDGIESRAVSSAMASHEAHFVSNLYQSETQLWQVPEGRELEIVQKLNADPSVDYAEPNYIYYASDILAYESMPDINIYPDDPSFNDQWGLSAINAPQAWSLTTGSDSVKIAIIDTGVDASHPELVDKLVPGYDFVDDDHDPADENGHGTHVAGIAAASTNNGAGTTGVCWNCRIMPIRVLNESGSGTNVDITQAITWAYQNGARVINLSLGGTYFSSSMQNAINNATNNGALVIAAMGNCREGCYVGSTYYVNPTKYPAGYNNVLAVAATNEYDEYAYYSQYGPQCDIAAPGGEMASSQDKGGILSTLPTNNTFLSTYLGFNQDYDYLQGTSQATPHVSGVAGLIFSMNPSFSPEEVEDILTSTALDLGETGWDQTYGYGRVDALAALHSIEVTAIPDLYSYDHLVYDGNYTLQWSEVPEAPAYVLQEDDNFSFNSPVTFDGLTQFAYSFIEKPAGTYYYRVATMWDQGTSSWSDIQMVIVEEPVSIFSSPAMIPIDNPDQDGNYTVEWVGIEGATGYVLEESTGLEFTLSVEYRNGAFAYQFDDHADGTWYYRVRAFNTDGVSLWSAVNSTVVVSEFQTFLPVIFSDNP